ncbi:hypothetical protein NDU88_005585 [Pleurodeles waltl]|uniref:Uncharacterized protein n=1 Tax=Pleurodeles waltl TaxID=8319 RepID=A0AAV7NR15_PLEWA|nr:hypothetical protein NDU88_005585 [Pleurodeles waltl]
MSLIKRRPRGARAEVNDVIVARKSKPGTRGASANLRTRVSGSIITGIADLDPKIDGEGSSYTTLLVDHPLPHREESQIEIQGRSDSLITRRGHFMSDLVGKTNVYKGVPIYVGIPSALMGSCVSWHRMVYTAQSRYFLPFPSQTEVLNKYKWSRK